MTSHPQPYAYHRDGAAPAADSKAIFVFGSNLGGRHGLGAALLARQAYGAKPGVGIGPTGQSYAIPTKGLRMEVLSLAVITRHVSEFLMYAAKNPSSTFFVTRVGCGYAGYGDKDIAPMFRAASDNCSFAQQWEQFLEVTDVDGVPQVEKPFQGSEGSLIERPASS